VKARLHGELVTGGLGAANDRKGMCGREVHNVTTEGREILLQVNDSRDGFNLKGFWT
jgi:hypothetical protein